MMVMVYGSSLDHFFFLIARYKIIITKTNTRFIAAYLLKLFSMVNFYFLLLT
jgi:hypothetical protein